MDVSVWVAVASPLLSAGVLGFVQFMISRRDAKKGSKSYERKALRYLMLYIIQERGKELLAAGSCTLEERRALQHWHEVYHNGLGGNGDADDLMEHIMSLDIKV